MWNVNWLSLNTIMWEKSFIIQPYWIDHFKWWSFYFSCWRREEFRHCHCSSHKLQQVSWAAELLLLSLFLAPPSTEAGGHRFMQVLLRFYDQFVQDKFISHKTMHKILPKWSLILFQSIWKTSPGHFSFLEGGLWDV